MIIYTLKEKFGFVVHLDSFGKYCHHKYKVLRNNSLVCLKCDTAVYIPINKEKIEKYYREVKNVIQL